jgi:hypothetical protein
MHRAHRRPAFPLLFWLSYVNFRQIILNLSHETVPLGLELNIISLNVKLFQMVFLFYGQQREQCIVVFALMLRKRPQMVTH